MATNRPVVATHITQHTLWAALSGEIPPLNLPATPIAHAVLDSRDAGPGDLFVAFSGQNADGHTYLPAALANGITAAIVEERGRGQALAAGAAVVDCTRGRWALTASARSLAADQPAYRANANRPSRNTETAPTAHR